MEFPVLVANPRVHQIIRVDPAMGTGTGLFMRQ
jgi:hypothetical protein